MDLDKRLVPVRELDVMIDVYMFALFPTEIDVLPQLHSLYGFHLLAGFLYLEGCPRMSRHTQLVGSGR